MALMESRMQAIPRMITCNGEAVMKLLRGTDLKGLNHSLKTYMAPLMGTSAPGKENNAKTELHTLAKEYLPFLVQLLKFCGAKLSSVPSQNDAEAVHKADELFSAMSISIEGLSRLRSMLTGCSFEIEIQRYGLVRRLMAWKKFRAALSQSELLFRSFCQLSSLPEFRMSTFKQTTSGRIAKGESRTNRTKITLSSLDSFDDAVLFPPKEVGLEPELPAIVVAAVIDFIWCIAESPEELAYIQTAARLPEQVAPWLRVLDAGTSTKQHDNLFRALYKCTLVVLANPVKFEPGLVHKFCVLTLSHCAASTQSDQYAKVARKLCTSLSCLGLDWCCLAVKLCTAAFHEILSSNELQGVLNTHELAELVDWFARSCQTSNQAEHGWCQIYGLMVHIRKVCPDSPVAVLGLYAVGLALMEVDAYCKDPQSRVKEHEGIDKGLPDLYKLEKNCQDKLFSLKACFLLNGAGEALQQLLQLSPTSSLGMMTDNGCETLKGHDRADRSSDGKVKVLGRVLSYAARALHFVQKPCTKFVQVVWNTCSSAAVPEMQLPYNDLNNALRKVLQLFYPLIENGIRCSNLSDIEKELFRKGYQMASQASLSALRLALLLQSGVQETFELVRDFICYLQPEEQWWLMSSTYNMGVQLFNVKQYGVACWPLDLAYRAAWAKINSSCSNVKSDAAISDMVSEACAKCLALVDAHNRDGQPEKSRLVLVNGLTEWMRLQTVTKHMKLPHALVKSFVKLMCIESKSSTENRAVEVCSLYNYICDIQPPLPATVVGLLLEEEHAICGAMVDQYSDTCHVLKEQIVGYLLEKLYIGGHFVLERSRVLITKCRDARMRGSENLPSCIKYISEAVSSLESALKSKTERAVEVLQVACLEKQLAVAYSIMGICLYELDPCSQEFLLKVVLSLNMWRCALELHNGHEAFSHPEVSSTSPIHEEEPLVLLLCITDLLSIQGYAVLLHEAQEVILKVCKQLKEPSTEEWLGFWMNRRAGHVLCAVPFPADHLSNIRRSFNSSASPQDFWQRYFDLFPGSLLEVHYDAVKEFHDLIHGEKGSRCRAEKRDGLEVIKGIFYARLLNGQKTVQFFLQTAAICHLISELAFQQGDTQEAIKYAKEAFQLRSRLFKHVFHGLGTRLSSANSNVTSLPEGRDCDLHLKDRLGPVTTSSWPFSINLQHCLSYPSQWRIVGDYIESLMQVGVIYERMGVVDEAERNFRQGHRLAIAHNLPMALAYFSSCLGEVQRKRQLWTAAESYFIQAKQAFDTLEKGRSCECCILTGKVLLEMRIGDLVRHCWCQQRRGLDLAGQSKTMEHVYVRDLSDALLHYNEATTVFSLFLKGCERESDFDERRLHKFHDNQTVILSNLQEQGKKVASEITSKNMEDTGTSGAKFQKSRPSRSVQTRSSGLSGSASKSVMERDLPVLNMRITSLTLDSGDTPLVEIRKNISDYALQTDGLSYERRNSQVINLEDQVAVADILEHTSASRQRFFSVQQAPETSSYSTKGGTMFGTTEAAGCFHSLVSRILGHSPTVEQWSACKWTQLSQKLWGRVLLQKGKCFIHLGELDEAAGIFDNALSILAQSNPKEGRSLFPVEEGALLYHQSRLCLQKRGGQHTYGSRQADGSRRADYDGVEACKSQSISRLYRAFSLCHQVPLLLHKIAKLLSILHVLPPACSVLCTRSHNSLSGQELSEISAYFHQASLGATIRQQHLALLDSKLDEPAPDCNQQWSPFLRKARVENMQRSLRIDPVDVGCLGMQARDFLENLPCSSACCISLVDMEEVNLLRGICFPSAEDSYAATDWLLITRLNNKCKPLVLLLPIGALQENPHYNMDYSESGESSSSPYDCSDDEGHGNNPSPEPKVYSTELINDIHKHKQPMLQRVAAEFGSVLEESRLSTSGNHPVATLEEKSAWWKWRMELDTRLSLLLRRIEESWLGPFKCLVLGEPQQPSMIRSFEFFTIYLCDIMSSMVSQRTNRESKTIDHSFVKVLLQGVGSLTTMQLEEAVARTLGFDEYFCAGSHANDSGGDHDPCQWKRAEGARYEQISKIASSFRAAYTLSVQACQEDSVKFLMDADFGNRRSRPTKGKPGTKSDNLLDSITRMLSSVSHCSDAPVQRQPLQLILDSDLQALPWESLPVLRDSEIYRMPSLGSIYAVYIQHQADSLAEPLRSRVIQKAEALKVEKKKVQPVELWPTPTVNEVDSCRPPDVTYVNPYNAYYILNPDGDLTSTQAAFEDWFARQSGWKGKAGTVPTAEEYQMGLQNHDLFVYLGHGSGDQFLHERYVRQLDHCAASLLMGCSSGRLSPRGEYEPVGVVLSYLMGGCPAVIANLWDVTDGDIDRFSRFLLHSWLASTSGSLKPEGGVRDIRDCELATRKATIKGGEPNEARQGRTKRKVNSRLLQEQTCCEGVLQDIQRMGSTIGQSRNACRLPHLIGASPVCYGVPTGVRRPVQDS